MRMASNAVAAKIALTSAFIARSWTPRIEANPRPRYTPSGVELNQTSRYSTSPESTRRTICTNQGSSWKSRRS
jgi:hypothetical protein